MLDLVSLALLLIGAPFLMLNGHWIAALIVMIAALLLGAYAQVERSERNTD